MRARHKNRYSRCKELLRQQRQVTRRLRENNKRLCQRNELQQQLIEQLKAQHAPQHLPHHHYPLQMIAMAIFIVVYGNGSLRCAAKTVGFYARLMGWKFSAPSHASVDNWVRRLGLYALGYDAHPKAGHYLTLVDESIQIGWEKCLLVLGCRLDPERSQFAPLRFEDVEVLGIEVRQSWTGDEIAEVIAQRCAHHADLKVDYVVSDQDPNLLKAYQQLGWTAIADHSHWLMKALKKSLADHGPLGKLTRWMGQYRQRFILSQFSPLCPATLRDKDRYAKLFAIVDWHERLQRLWPTLSQAEKQSLAFVERADMVALIEQLRQVRGVAVLATDLLKTAGLSPRTQQLWQQRCAELQTEVVVTDLARQIAQAVDEYFGHHATLLKEQHRYLCCSDVIESPLGYYKNKGGMKVISSDMLRLPLRCQSITLDFVRQSLSRVRQKQVDSWLQRRTCDNRYSRLRRLKTAAKTNKAAA